MTRQELDQRMRECLARIETCSHVPAGRLQPTGPVSGGGATEGGGRPPGDLGHTYLARQYGPPFHEASREYPGAQSDRERGHCLERARRELEHLRGLAPRPKVEGETAVQRDARIVRDGVGLPARDVAIACRCGEMTVRRAREAAGRDPRFGRALRPERAPADHPGCRGHADRGDRKARAVQLRREGLSIRAIALILGAGRGTVERDLHDTRAAATPGV